MIHSVKFICVLDTNVIYTIEIGLNQNRSTNMCNSLCSP